ncbi:hypothetical protein pb186bvf_017337 [Paramecium bursaria]
MKFCFLGLDINTILSNKCNIQTPSFLIKRLGCFALSYAIHPQIQYAQQIQNYIEKCINKKDFLNNIQKKDKSSLEPLIGALLFNNPTFVDQNFYKQVDQEYTLDFLMNAYHLPLAKLKQWELQNYQQAVDSIIKRLESTGELTQPNKHRLRFQHCCNMVTDILECDSQFERVSSYRYNQVDLSLDFFYGGPLQKEEQYLFNQGTIIDLIHNGTAFSFNSVSVFDSQTSQQFLYKYHKIVKLSQIYDNLVVVWFGPSVTKKQIHDFILSYQK